MLLIIAKQQLTKHFSPIGIIYRSMKSSNETMALKGIKVVEMAGLAPAPLCGMLLSDFGATVIRIDKAANYLDVDRLGRGKRSLAVDLKSPEGIEVLQKLCKTSDVLIEPFRKGIMEKLKLGPNDLMQDNPRLIYARLTGYGQSGYFSERAGHDINYLAISGILSLMGRKDEPFPPINLLADFAGGGLICAFGILMALFEREKSGKGQVIDASMVEGAAYLSSWLWTSRDLFTWGNQKGENILDGGSHFYNTYKTKDGKYMAVGALEPQFYNEFIKNLDPSLDIDQFTGDPEKGRQTFQEIFAQKTQAEWCAIFDEVDACVTPVLSLDEAAQHPHATGRGSFVNDEATGQWVPWPAPRFDKISAIPRLVPPKIGEHSVEILTELGLDKEEIDTLLRKQVVLQSSRTGKL